MATRYDPGDVTTTTFTVATVDGTPSDPLVVRLEIKAPTADKVTYTYGAMGSPIVKVSTGVYSCPIALTEGGRWNVVWSGAGMGAVECAEPGYVDVVRRAFA